LASSIKSGIASKTPFLECPKKSNPPPCAKASMPLLFNDLESILDKKSSIDL